jgi:hypothetical protein
MGSRLVAAALLPLADLGLSHRARIVLIGMCNMAIDKADPPVYYGGWERLAGCLGYAEYGPNPERQVAKAVAELRKAGLIVVVREGAWGRNAEYGIRLWITGG